MARTRMRRLHHRKAPAVRRSSGDLIVGGAKDPAERAADHLAAKALAGGAKARHQTATALRRSAPQTTLAPGAASARAPHRTAQLVASLSAGRGLNVAERGYFEPRFGADLSAVRLHEGAQADRATRALDAEAFAHGPDIAFANGKRNSATLAHELAHTVLNRPSRLRRKIATEVKGRKPSDLRHVLRKCYGVRNVRRRGNTFTLRKAILSGSLNTEIVSSMLASTRTFTLEGKRLGYAKASLRDHLQARRGIVDLAKTIRVAFPSKAASDNLLGGVLRFIAIEVATNLTRKIARLRKKPDPKTYGRMAVSETIRVLQKHGGSKRVRDAVRIIRRKSRAYDRLKRVDKAKPFVAACFSATATVMYGGSDSKMKEDKVPLPKKGQNIAKSALMNDWVPGDWGYIGSYIENPSFGLQGESIVYVGKDLFWGHHPAVNKPQSLPAWLFLVSTWEQHKVPKRKRGMVDLTPQRTYPAKGLK